MTPDAHGIRAPLGSCTEPESVTLFCWPKVIETQETVRATGTRPRKRRRARETSSDAELLLIWGTILDCDP